MGRAIVRAPLTALGADQLGHLELHHLRADGLGRLADHVGMLIDSTCLTTSSIVILSAPAIAGAPLRRTLRSPTIMSATGPQPRREPNHGSIPTEPFRPSRSYTNPRDVTKSRRRAKSAAQAMIGLPCHTAVTGTFGSCPLPAGMAAPTRDDPDRDSRSPNTPAVW